MVRDMMVRDNDHRCQACAAVGPLWKGGTCFRGGTITKPRRAILMCVAPGCLRNFCSAACFNLNWWHVGSEFAPTRRELQGDIELSEDDDSSEGEENLPVLSESSCSDDDGESSDSDDVAGE